MDYEKQLQDANELLAKTKNVKVDLNNRDKYKKQVAEIRATINKLNDDKKALKRRTMAPYKTVETNVMAIIKTYRKADTNIRSQIKILDDADQDKTKSQILKLWNCTVTNYLYMWPFDDWWDNCYLSFGPSKVYQYMINWLDARDRDLRKMSNLPNRKDVWAEYITCYDFKVAVERAARRAKYKAAVEEAKQQTALKCGGIVVYNGDDLEVLKMFCKSHNINFSEIEG